MQKQAWIFSMTATVMGAFGVLIRWLQCQAIFEEETGLAARGAFVSYLVVLMLAVFVLGLWWLSGRVRPGAAREEPEDALSLPGRETGWVLTAAAILAGGGAVLMFFTEGELLMKVTALLGLISAAVLAMIPSLPRWGGFGAFLSVIPVVFFSLWLVLFYKTNSVNPVLWQYAVQILAIAACLFSVFRLSGYLFYRMRPRRTVFACGLALAFALTVLMDEASFASRMMFAGWGIGLGILSWVLVRNFDPDKTEAENEG